MYICIIYCILYNLDICWLETCQINIFSYKLYLQYNRTDWNRKYWKYSSLLYIYYSSHKKTSSFLFFGICWKDCSKIKSLSLSSGISNLQRYPVIFVLVKWGIQFTTVPCNLCPCQVGYPIYNSTLKSLSLSSRISNLQRYPVIFANKMVYPEDLSFTKFFSIG